MLFYSIIFISCQNSNQQPKIVDENFETFLIRFNKDSIFQLNRIDFPITVEEFSTDDFQSKKRIIREGNYQKMDLSYDESIKIREFDKYTQVIKFDKQKAIIEIRGIDNGIYEDVVFEKKNGKWKLITWIDSST